MQRVEQLESAGSSLARHAAARQQAAEPAMRLDRATDVLRLQQLAGNAAIARMLTSRASGQRLQRAIQFGAAADVTNTDGATKELDRKKWMQALVAPELERIFGTPFVRNTVDTWATGQPRQNEPPRAKRVYQIKELTGGWGFLGIDFAKPLTTADIAVLNEQIHKIEIAVDPSLAAPKSIASTEFGSELTFVNVALESIKDVTNRDEITRNRGPYNEVALAWKGAMTQRGVEPTKEQRFDNMLYLTYEFSEATHGVDWSYRVTPISSASRSSRRRRTPRTCSPARSAT